MLKMGQLFAGRMATSVNLKTFQEDKGLREGLVKEAVREKREINAWK